ncbi:MAG TPA: SDR family NAD(P)-dependent oxidoreductase [Solirubrobacteraceae bacterium]|nr:SDR family NAD(P)-dependent oxidoreductase [Solirubrobacteraceae bacterium]
MTDSMLPLDDLRGQVAIVTGGARGLGLATGRRLAAAGATTVLVDLDGDGVARAARELTDAGLQVHGVAADLTDEDGVVAMVSETIEAHGRIDALVNLAAIFPRVTIDEMSLDVWHSVLAASLDTTFLCCRAVLPHMRRAGYGRIVNTASGAVHLAPADRSAYVTAKMGVIGFTRCVANDAGADGITANVIMPGAIETEGSLSMRANAEAAKQAASRIIAQQAVKRRGMPEDIAAAIAYMVGPASGFLTGQIVNVGGGITFTA